jgi:hypothetical protein
VTCGFWAHNCCKYANATSIMSSQLRSTVTAFNKPRCSTLQPCFSQVYCWQLLYITIRLNGPGTHVKHYKNLDSNIQSRLDSLEPVLDPADPRSAMAVSNLTVNPVVRILTDLARQSKHIA